jgi:hypothetical protein
MLYHFRTAILAGFFLFLACGCASFPSPYPGDLQHGWEPAHLLLIKDPGSINPEHAIIAFYMRQRQDDLEFRLDLLELQNPYANDIYLALDTQPGGSATLPNGELITTNWDILLVVPAFQPPYALGPNGQIITGLIPGVVRDSSLGTIIIQINKNALPGDANRLRVQAILTDPTTQQTFDQTPTLSAGSQPPAPAPLLLAFYDTLPASTPVQALRRWDGAHTGPLGQRHGLATLVNQASSRNIPITLLDLKTPASLSALDLVGGAAWLKKLEAKDLLNLPLTADSDPATTPVSLAYSNQAVQSFGFQSSQIGYGPFEPGSLPPLKAFFFTASDSNHIVQWHGTRFIPLPEAEDPQNPIAGPDGPSLEFKKQLLRIALSPEIDLLTVGGSLPNNELADLSVGPLFFEYIATHPWIKPLSGSDLLGFDVKEVQSLPIGDCSDLLCTKNEDSVLPGAKVREQVRAELANLPDSTIKDQAWQEYFLLSKPMALPFFSAAQARYIGQVGYLIAAARWAQNPAVLADCSLDIDWDGQPDCILASPQVFSIIKLDGGRMVFAGFLKGQDVIQWVGTKSQFALNWDSIAAQETKNGPASDPTEVPGAFFDRSQYSPYHASISGSRLELNSAEFGITKSFTVTASELLVQIKSSQADQTKIPLVLDAPGRFQPGWQETYPQPDSSGDSFRWQPTGRPGVEINISNAALTSNSFLDSRSYMTQPEIPDRDYPPGHYLPFPLSVLELRSDSDFEVQFIFSP